MNELASMDAATNLGSGGSVALAGSLARRRIFLFSGSFLLLALGGMIYAGWRADHLYCNRLAGQVLPPDLLAAFRGGPVFRWIARYPWLTDCFPNGLWAAAWCLGITGIWTGTALRRWEKALWLMAVPLTGILLECGQAFGIVKGTFDFGDLLALGIGSATALWCLRYLKEA